MHLKIVDQYRGLPASVYVLALERLISAVGQFVFPFLTMFLSSRIGLSDQEVSLFLTLMACTMAVGAPLGGRLADRFNRKYVYIILMLLGDGFFVLAGFFVDSMAVVWLILAAYFFIYMTHPVQGALVMDLTTPANRQESFSLTYLGYNLGYAFGPLIAGLLFENYTSWLFFGQVILGALGLTLMLIYVKDARPDQQALAAIAADSSRRHEQAKQGSMFKLLWNDKFFLSFILLCALFAFAYSQMAYILPLDMERMFGVSQGSKFYGAVWSINGACVFLITPLAVLLGKRRPPLANLSLAALLYALGFGCYAFAHQLWLIYGLAVLWTAGEVICHTNAQVLIANRAPASHRARYQSMYEVLAGCGRALGPLLMGLFLLGRTYAQGWLLTGGVCLGAAAGFLLLRRQEKHK